MIKMQNFRNSTSLDELGTKYKLLRGRYEGLDDYYKRIYKAIREDYKYNQRSFYNSLGYVTELQEKILFRITPKEENLFLFPVIEITDTNLYILEGENISLDLNLKEYKFLEDVYNKINELDLFNIEILEEEYKYLKSEYLIPCKSYRAINNFITDDYITRLPKKYIAKVMDFNGNFIYNKSDAELIFNEKSYSLNENILTKYYRGSEKIHIEYYDYPFIVKWAPIKSYEIYKDDFKKITHDQDGNLNQEGAKIYNMILDKQNTYWGE